MIKNNDQEVARHLEIALQQIKKANIHLQSKSGLSLRKSSERSIALRALENAIGQLVNAQDRLTRDDDQVSA